MRTTIWRTRSVSFSPSAATNTKVAPRIVMAQRVRSFATLHTIRRRHAAPSREDSEATTYYWVGARSGAGLRRGSATTCKDDTRSTNDRTPTSARRTSPNRKVQPHNFSLQQNTKGGAVLCTCCVSLFTVSLQTHLSQQTLVGSLKTSQHVCAPLWDSV